MSRGRLFVAGALLAAGPSLLASLATSSGAQSWPKADMARYAQSFAGKTYVMKLPGLGNTLVYAAPDKRAYVVRSMTSKIYPGRWEITYSMSNRSIAACIKGPGTRQCTLASSIARFPAKPGDVFGLSNRRSLSRSLPINFGFAEVGRAAR